MAKKTRTLSTGDEIEFLKGEALSRRMEELADEANREHREATAAMRGMLEHARSAGKALIEAKARKGHRTKWTKWLHKNFEASPETARVYMRIARQWDDPRIVDARARGLSVTSIKGFLDVIRNKKEKPKDKAERRGFHELTPEEQREMLSIDMRHALRASFSGYVRKLKYEELEVLAELLDHRLLPAMHRELKDWVCVFLEEDYYNEWPMKKKRAARTRAKRIKRRGKFFPPYTEPEE